MWQLPFDVALIEKGKTRSEKRVKSSGKLWKAIALSEVFEISVKCLRYL